MASVAKAMASPESGLEVRDRMWLKITIPNAFLGKTKKSTFVSWTLFSRGLNKACIIVLELKPCDLGRKKTPKVQTWESALTENIC